MASRFRLRKTVEARQFHAADWPAVDALDVVRWARQFGEAETGGDGGGVRFLLVRSHAERFAPVRRVEDGDWIVHDAGTGVASLFVAVDGAFRALYEEVSDEA